MPYRDVDEDDDGLPDDDFIALELALGVQHIFRTGNPDATHSGRGAGPSTRGDDSSNYDEVAGLAQSEVMQFFTSTLSMKLGHGQRNAQVRRSHAQSVVAALKRR